MKFLKTALFPLFIAWPVAVGYFSVRSGFWAHLGLQGTWGDLAYFVVAIGPVALGLAVLERVIPYRVDWNQARDDVPTDVAHVFFNWLAVGYAGRILAAGLYYSLAGSLAARLGGAPWPSSWPLLLQLVLALVISELGHYVLHRAAHEVPFLWRFHAVHHSAPRLYWFNASRFHLLEILTLTILQTGPLVILGCGKEVFLLFGGLTTIFGWIQHTNADFRPGWLNTVFATNELHQWHHSKNLEEGNRNYGAVLILWDIVFGSFFWPRDRRFSTEAGIHGDADFPRGFLAQQLSPFWRMHPTHEQVTLDLSR